MDGLSEMKLKNFKLLERGLLPMDPQDKGFLEQVSRATTAINTRDLNECTPSIVKPEGSTSTEGVVATASTTTNISSIQSLPKEEFVNKMMTNQAKNQNFSLDLYGRWVLAEAKVEELKRICLAKRVPRTSVNKDDEILCLKDEIIDLEEKCRTSELKVRRSIALMFDVQETLKKSHKVQAQLVKQAKDQEAGHLEQMKKLQEEVTKLAFSNKALTEENFRLKGLEDAHKRDVLLLQKKLCKTVESFAYKDATLLEEKQLLIKERESIEEEKKLLLDRCTNVRI